MGCSDTSDCFHRFWLVPLLRAKYLQPLVSLLSVAALSAGAQAQPVTPVSLADMAAAAPSALRAADTERALFAWNAIGSQIYECRGQASGGFAWTFVAPDAELFNEDDGKVGTHGAGPFWSALDGSRTVGTVKARADGAGPADIALLLLSARPGTIDGMLTPVTSVQRLNTKGGNPPATGCETQADSSKRIRQAYSADYVFFGPR